MSPLGDLVDGLEIGIVELDGLEVALDPGRVGALGQDDVASLQPPCDQHLRKSVVPLLRDLVEGLVRVDLFACGRYLVLRS